MNREIDNALLVHGGTEDIDIPAPAVRAILTDAVCSGELVREIESLPAAECRAGRSQPSAGEGSATTATSSRRGIGMSVWPVGRCLE